MNKRVQDLLEVAGGFALKHQLSVFIFSSIAISIVLVVVALTIYTNSGSLQLDLSRPGYEGVRQDITRPSPSVYSPTGPMDRDSVDEFLEMYNKQLKDIETIDAFGGGVLVDSSLGIDDVPAETE